MPNRLLIAFLLPGFLACSRPPDTSQHVQRTDDLGREVYVPKNITRVVTLAPSITELVFAAGAGHKLVGVTDADDYPAAVGALPRFSALPVDFETVLALKPDLVLATDQVNSTRDAATFIATGVPTFFFSVDGLEGMLQAIGRMADLLGTHSNTADSLRASLHRLRRRLDTVATRPSTLFLISDETLYGFGKGSHIHEVIGIAGGESVTAHFETRAPILSDEFVLMEKPDVIVGSFGQGYDPDRLLLQHPTWDIVPALVDKRVYSVERDFFLRPGPRLVEGAWQLARLLHPDLTP